jgi:hypothetical protein
MPLTKVQSRGTENVGQGSSNVIINGAMNVAQRGTSSTGIGASDGYFVCDRWYLDSGATTAGRLTMTQDSSAPSGFANSLKVACTTADTSIASGEQLLIQQRIEGQNLQAFAKGTSDAKEFAVSFYVKGNASATYICELHDQDNGRQCSKTFSVTTDWTRIELIFPADTTGAFDDDNARSLNFNIALHAGATYTSGTLNSSAFATTNNNNRYVGGSSFFDSTSRTFFITGVQIEVGSQVSDFQHEDIGATLEKCQRYFLHFGYGGNALLGTASYYRANLAILSVWFPTFMRTAPSVVENLGSTGNQSFIVYTENGADYVSSTAIARQGHYGCHLEIGNGSGTIGHAGSGSIQYADQSVQFNAEL